MSKIRYKVRFKKLKFKNELMIFPVVLIFVSCSSIYVSLHAYCRTFGYLKIKSRRFSSFQTLLDVSSVTIVGGGAAGYFSAIQCAQIVNKVAVSEIKKF